MYRMYINTYISGHHLKKSPSRPSRCQKRPSMCQKRPSMCQKRPSMCQKRPSMSQKRPSMCQKRPSMCQKRPSMCQKRPSMCQKGPSMCQKRPTTSRRVLAGRGLVGRLTRGVSHLFHELLLPLHHRVVVVLLRVHCNNLCHLCVCVCV